MAKRARKKVVEARPRAGRRVVAALLLGLALGRSDGNGLRLRAHVGSRCRLVLGRAERAASGGDGLVPGGEYSMGTDDPKTMMNERPALRVPGRRVLDGRKHDVTNGESGISWRPPVT